MNTRKTKETTTTIARYIDLDYFINTYNSQHRGTYDDTTLQYYLDYASVRIYNLKTEPSWEFASAPNWSQQLVQYATAVLAEHWLKQGNNLSLSDISGSIGSISFSGMANRPEYVPKIVLDLLIKAQFRVNESFALDDEGYGDIDTYSPVFKTQEVLNEVSIEQATNDDLILLTKDETIKLLQDATEGEFQFKTKEYLHEVSLNGDATDFYVYKVSAVDSLLIPINNNITRLFSVKANVSDVYTKAQIDVQQQDQNKLIKFNTAKGNSNKREIDQLKLIMEEGGIARETYITPNATSVTNTPINLDFDVDVNSTNPNVINNLNIKVAGRVSSTLYISCSDITLPTTLQITLYKILGPDLNEDLVSKEIIYNGNGSQIFNFDINSPDPIEIGFKVQTLETGNTLTIDAQQHMVIDVISEIGSGYVSTTDDLLNTSIVEGETLTEVLNHVYGELLVHTSRLDTNDENIININNTLDYLQNTKLDKNIETDSTLDNQITRTIKDSKNIKTYEEKVIQQDSISEWGMQVDDKMMYSINALNQTFNVYTNDITLVDKGNVWENIESRIFNLNGAHILDPLYFNGDVDTNNIITINFYNDELTTIDKTGVGAINEINTIALDNKANKVDKVNYLSVRDRNAKYEYINTTSEAGIVFNVESSGADVGAKLIFAEGNTGTFFYHNLYDTTGTAIGYVVDRPESFTDKNYVDNKIDDVQNQIEALLQSITSDKGVIKQIGPITLNTTSQNIVATSIEQFDADTVVQIVQDPTGTYIDRQDTGNGALWFQMYLDYVDNLVGNVVVELFDWEDPTIVKATISIPYEFTNVEGSIVGGVVVGSIHQSFAVGKTGIRFANDIGSVLAKDIIVTEYVGSSGVAEETFFLDGVKVQDVKWSDKADVTYVDGKVSEINVELDTKVDKTMHHDFETLSVDSHFATNWNDHVGSNTQLTLLELKEVNVGDTVSMRVGINEDRTGSIQGRYNYVNTDGTITYNAVSVVEKMDLTTKEYVDNELEKIKMPVGSIVITTTAPAYGTWEDLGELADGQALIGGATSNGEVISHKHSLSMDSHHHTQSSHYHYMFDSGNSPDDSSPIASDHAKRRGGNGNDSYYMRNTTTTPTVVKTSSTAPTINSTTSTGTIGSTGGTYNKAWGLGIGTGMHLWKRTA